MISTNELHLLLIKGQSPLTLLPLGRALVYLLSLVLARQLAEEKHFL